MQNSIENNFGKNWFELLEFNKLRDSAVYQTFYK